jgi:hypothetical protein
MPGKPGLVFYVQPFLLQPVMTLCAGGKMISVQRHLYSVAAHSFKTGTVSLNIKKCTLVLYFVFRESLTRLITVIRQSCSSGANSLFLLPPHITFLHF